jgi:hypothetical protein
MKYAIQYKTSDKKTDYIRDGIPSLMRHPMLTPNVNMIKKEYIYDHIGDAQNGINDIVKQNKLILADIAKSAKQNPGSSMWFLHKMNAQKKYIDASRYSIVEYVPEFAFKKGRKLDKRDWIVGSASSFCNNCGSSMYMGSYFQIGQSKVCAFCLETLGKQAKEHIDTLGETARDDHNNSIFIEEME